MCPFYFAMFGPAVAGAALHWPPRDVAVSTFRKEIGTREVTPISNERKSGDVNGHDRQREGSVAR
jgi:hypothetical protein